jgi:hypothetical protein
VRAVIFLSAILFSPYINPLNCGNVTVDINPLLDYSLHH